MFTSIQQRDNQDSSAIVDMAPLIDIVFILLIFFLVTTTFVRETGIDVTRPQARNTQRLDHTSLRISITPTGQVYADQRPMTLAQLRYHVQQFIKQHPQEAIILVPDTQLTSGKLVEVMDTARGAGAHHLIVSTEKK